MRHIPAGSYLARATPVDGAYVQWGPATPKSPFTAAVAFEILGGECDGAILTKFFYFGDVLDKGGKTAMDRSLEALRIIGFNGNDIDSFADQHPTNQVEITVEHQEYQGKTQVRIGFVNRPGGSGGLKLKEKLAPVQLKSISTRLKGRLAKVPEVVTAPIDPETITPSKPGADAGVPASDDEIPF